MEGKGKSREDRVTRSGVEEGEGGMVTPGRVTQPLTNPFPPQVVSACAHGPDKPRNEASNGGRALGKEEGKPHTAFPGRR